MHGNAVAVTLGGGVVKRSARLADGRELLYFDDPDTTLGPERAIDARELDPRPATAEMRQDVLTGDWISVAAARQNRAFLPPKDLDPLAPQRPGNPSEIPSDYDVAVFENKSPSFGPALPDPGIDPLDLATLDHGRRAPSYGRCEVVCFSPAHEGSFGSLSPTRARTVIEAWSDRTRALSALPGIAQVFVFENRGQEIGVTLQHPHGQIYAYPYITPRTQRLLSSLDARPALFQEIVAFERTGDRVLAETEHWIAFVPFAARWPVEVHLLPTRHVPDFAALTDEERDELAPLYLRLLRGIDALYETATPYIAAWHQAPVGVARDRARLNLQITSPRRAADKLKFLAGSEAAMGAWIADLTPEASAARLRDALEGITL